MIRTYRSILLLFLLYPTALFAGGDAAESSYVKAEDYIARALTVGPAKAQLLWVTKDIRPDIEKILKRSNFPLRYRYWRAGDRTVWILDEIGKVLPITTGITIEGGKIIDLTVLTYRESHGAEIRFPAYRSQFTDVELAEDLRLSKPIHGISGATLSTNAMKRVSRLALYLHNKVMEKNDAKKQ